MIYFIRRQSLRISHPSRIKERVAYLPTLRSVKGNAHFILDKIQSEVKIFNKLFLVMPCRGNAPKKYFDYLAKIYNKPKISFRTLASDACPYSKLMYLYACMTLYIKSKDYNLRRQLVKNMMCNFHVSPVIKRRVTFNKLATCNFYAGTGDTSFKILANRKIISGCVPNPFEITVKGHPVKFRPILMNSYVHHTSDTMRVKNYHDKTKSIECFEISSAKPQLVKFIHKSEVNKMSIRLSQTSDAFFYVCNLTKKTTAIYAEQKKQFGTNMTSRQNDLNVNVELEINNEPVKVFVITAETKPQAIKTITWLKDNDNEIDFLLTKREILVNKLTENVLTELYNSRYINGSKLRTKYLDALKYIPSLHLPSHVIPIETQADFFKVIDNLDVYRKLSELGLSFNVIFLYSSQNGVTEVIKSFMDTEVAKELIKRQLFLYFIDKMTTPVDVVNLLYKAFKAGKEFVIVPNVPIATTHKKVMITTQVKDNAQVIIITSQLNKAIQITATIPIDIGKKQDCYFMLSSVIAKIGTKLVITSMRSGRTYTLKIPKGTKVFSAQGMPIHESGEYTTDKILLQIETKLKPYEERIFEITKQSMNSIQNQIESISALYGTM